MLSCVILAALANIAGGLIIFIKKEWSKRALGALMAVSAGLLLSIAVLDLIPDVMESHTVSPVFILIGLLIIFFIQQWAAPHFHHGEDVHSGAQSKSAVTGSVVGMIVHTFFDGFSIVASFEVDIRLGITVLIAIFLHKIPDGVTISSIVFSFSRNKKRAVEAAVLMGVATLVGGFCAWLVTGFYFPNEAALSIALSVTAGIFLYVAATDLLPVINGARDRLMSLFFFLSILAYFILQWGLEQLHVGFH
jgi:ZIP family zinc transporter/zinc and cadmium transporter